LVGGAFAKTASAGLAGIFAGIASGPFCEAVGSELGGAFAKTAGAGLAGIFAGGASGPFCCEAVGSEIGGAFAKTAGAGLAGIFVGGASGPFCCEAVGSELGGALHGAWQCPAELTVGRAGAAGGIFIGAAFVDATGADGGALAGESPPTNSAGGGLLGAEMFGKAIGGIPSISAGRGLLGTELLATTAGGAFAGG